MAQLVQLEVHPTTEGAVPGGDPIPYQAIGHYSDGSTADLTSVATWTSGDASVAAFSDNVLAPLGEGYASIQASVAGVTNDDAALAYVSTDSRPVIFYAGYADTYLTSSTGGDLVIEARVADPQNDVSIVVLFINGVALPGLPFNDSGIAADRIAGDGVLPAGYRTAALKPWLSP